MNFRGPLPGHLAIGRGAPGGPVTGGQIMLCSHVGAVTSLTEIIVAGWIMPLDIRVHAWCVYLRILESGAPGATLVTLRLYKNSAATFSTTGATALTAAFDVTAAGGRVIAGTLDDGVSAGTSVIARGARDVLRGDTLFITALTDAAAGVSDLSMQIVGVTRGHANTVLSED